MHFTKLEYLILNHLRGRQQGGPQVTPKHIDRTLEVYLSQVLRAPPE
jgi:hypothetical protein